MRWWAAVRDAAIGLGCWTTLIAAGAAACSTNIFDTDIALEHKAFTASFGSQSGTLPVATCDPQDPAACGGGGGDVSAQDDGSDGGGGTLGSVTVGCDADSASCYAQADATLAVTVGVVQDDDFVGWIERRVTVFVRLVDVAVWVPTNTLTFDVPRIDVYVGPEGTASTSDPGVIPVDHLDPLPAGTTIAAADARHLTIAAGSPARAFIESSVGQRRRFVFLLVLSLRLDSGAPIPAGTVHVELQPVVRLGLPR